MKTSLKTTITPAAIRSALKMLAPALLICLFFTQVAYTQCTTGCGQAASTNIMPGTNNFSNTFCITTGSTLTYNQNFDMNGGTVCVGPNVTFSAGGGNWNGNWTVNNYGSVSRSITLNTGQVFNNYGTFTGSVSLNGGTIVNHSGAGFNPSSFNFNGGSFTNNSGATASFSSSVTINSGSTFVNNGTLTTTGITLNSGAVATLSGNTTINGNVSNNGTLSVSGILNVSGNYNQNSSGITNSLTSSQCNTIVVTGNIQGQGTYNGSNGLLLNKPLYSPTCTSCLINGASTTPPAQPANQIAAPALAASASSITGTVVNPGGSPAATNYIVLRRFGSAVTDQPSNYTSYTVGATAGNSVVVAINPISTLTFTDVNAVSSNGCGTYHYAVFTYNTTGSCGVFNRTLSAANMASITVSGAGGTVSTSKTVCTNATSGLLTLTGYSGAVVRWESAVSPFSSWSAIANTATTYTSGPLTQTTRFRAVVNAGTACGDQYSAQATITVNAVPAAPAGTSASRCGTGTVTITATPGAGEIIDWYAAATGGTALLSGNTSYTTPSISANTTYFAEARNTTTGCLSPTRTALTATVNGVPSVTLGLFSPICSGTSSTTLNYTSPVNSPNEYFIDWSTAANTAGLADVNWAALSGGTITVTGLPAAAGFYAATVYVRNSVTGCQRDVTNGTVVSCGTANEYSSLTMTAPASGVFTAINFTSYGTPTGTCGNFAVSSCHSATSMAAVQAAALGNNSFTIAASNGVFGDPCVTITKRLYVEAISTAQVLNIYAIPTVVSVANGSTCQQGTVNLSATASPGATIDWYANATGGTPLATGTVSYTTPVLNASATYYAEARNTTAGCLATTRTAVIASVYALPAAPAASAASRCGNGTVTLTATPGSGETIDWYATATGGTALATGSATFTTPALSANTTYYAEARTMAGSCLSATRTAVNVTVNPSPSVTLANFTPVCSGTTSVTLAYTSPVNSPNQYMIDWSATANTAGLSDVAWTPLSGGTITVPGLISTAGDYAANIFVRNTTTGCQTDVSNGTVTTCGTVVENASITLTAPGGGVFSAINFASYGLPNGSCGAFTIGSCHATSSLTVVQNAALGRNSFTLGATNVNFGDPCVGTGKRLYIEAVSVGQLLTINAMPAISASNPATRCGTGTATISATPSAGATTDWFTTATGGTPLLTGNNSFTTPSISATTTYYAEARNTTTGCIAATRTAVTATVTVPTICCFSPASAGTGTSVVITGTNFTGATAVSFGGTAATSFTVNSATQITAVVAGGTSGNVSVTTACGTVTRSGFTYIPAPTITIFTPTSGYIGNTITITGTNFTGATSVSFGGSAAASFTVVSSTSITAVLNTGATGSVSVTTPGGTASLAGFTYIPATTWTGSVSSAWLTAGNWNNGVPGATSLVFVPAVATLPTISSNVSTGSLTLNSNATITVNSGNTISMTGSFTNNGTISGAGTIVLNGTTNQAIGGNGTVNNITINNTAGATIAAASGNMLNIRGTLTPTAGTLTTNGNLTLVSNASGTARVAAGSAAGNYINGQVTWQRYIPARRAWRMINYPLTSSGAPTINAAMQEGAGGTSNNPNPGFGTHITGGSAANGFDQNPAGNASLKESSGTNWIGVSNTNQPVTSNKAYFLFVRGSRANNLAQGTGAATDNTTLRGRGNLRQGNQSVSISGSGWQLVGNPFAGAINLNAVAVTNSSLINRNFKFWDPKLGGSNNVGGYVTASYNGSTYDYAPAPVSSLTEFAQSGSVFYADAKSAGTLVINEAHKSASGSDNVFRPSATQAKLYINLMSVNTNGTTPVVDGVMAGFDADFSNKLDEYDASKLSIGGVESLSMLRAGNQLSIERRMPVNTEDTIYLNMGNMGRRGYKLEFDFSNFDSPFLTAWLEDTETGITTPLNTNAGSIYDFTIAGNYDANRFRVIFKNKGSVVLPVTFKSISATKENNDVLVNWQVENQVNIATYEIEKSADGVRFEKAGSQDVVGANNSAANYKWLDGNSFAGENFYRIKIIDIDGKFSFSPVAKIAIVGDESISIYPNPVVNNTYQLHLEGKAKGSYKVNTYNSAGQIIATNQFHHYGSNASKTIKPGVKLLPGNYKVEVINGNGKPVVINILVQ